MTCQSHEIALCWLSLKYKHTCSNCTSKALTHTLDLLCLKGLQFKSGHSEKRLDFCVMHQFKHLKLQKPSAVALTISWSLLARDLGYFLRITCFEL